MARPQTRLTIISTRLLARSQRIGLTSFHTSGITLAKRGLLFRGSVSFSVAGLKLEPSSADQPSSLPWAEEGEAPRLNPRGRVEGVRSLIGGISYLFLPLWSGGECTGADASIFGNRGHAVQTMANPPSLIYAMRHREL